MCKQGFFYLEVVITSSKRGHTKLQVELFEMHCFRMFITALCVIFLVKLARSSIRPGFESCITLGVVVYLKS